VKKKQWLLAPQAPQDYIDALRACDIDSVLGQIFYRRRFETPQDVLDFLGRYQREVDPFLLKGMPETVERLWSAIDNHEPIGVYGDFDCDGVTSTVLLTEVLRCLGAKQVRPYIPDRVDEGYGLNSPALKFLADKGCKVVVTVDCGIRSIAEVIDGHHYGLDMIISDHHSIGPEIPPALAVINPKQETCAYPEKMLAGVGLAYKIAQALFEEASRRGKLPDGLAADDWLDLVALGTVADIAPLRGENRMLVQRGLELLNRPQRIGLRALYGVAGIKPGNVTSTTIGFAIGPRINAAGRLRSATLAGKLLATVDQTEAGRIASELNAINHERQQKTHDMQEWAEEAMPGDPAERMLLFSADSRFEQGVVGLVASRLTEQYYRPSVVVQVGESESHGSCRSIPEFHITHALDACTELLDRFGGHAAAAGFTVRNDNIEPLREQLEEIASSELADRDLAPVLEIDLELRLASATPIWQAPEEVGTMW
jgi:single-stranded-DNA-specific exonuclease